MSSFEQSFSQVSSVTYSNQSHNLPSSKRIESNNQRTKYSSSAFHPNQRLANQSLSNQITSSSDQSFNVNAGVFDTQQVHNQVKLFQNQIEKIKNENISLKVQVSTFQAENHYLKDEVSGLNKETKRFLPSNFRTEKRI
jgi:FtsZ-binding cell division protein ZapB